LGLNDDSLIVVAQPFLAFVFASQEREFGEDVRKRERSRARRTSTPACGVPAAPSSVSAGRRRPKVAVTDGREKTRGRQTLDGQTERNDWTSRSDERERAGGRENSRQKEHRPGVKRKRGWKGYSSVSYVVSVESDGIESGTPRVPGVIGRPGGGERARAEPNALFRAQYARRARFVRCSCPRGRGICQCPILA